MSSNRPIRLGSDFRNQNRAGQLDVPHAVAPDLAERDLDTAFFADDAAVFHPLVLAAKALVVLDRTEYAGTEQAVALRFEGAVVDGLRLLDLAIGPRADAFRAGDRNTNLIEALSARRLAEDVHQLFHRCLPIRVV
jgi:hypothetical protein